MAQVIVGLFEAEHAPKVGPHFVWSHNASAGWTATTTNPTNCCGCGGGCCLCCCCGFHRALHSLRNMVPWLP